MKSLTPMLGVRFGLTLPNGKGILSPPHTPENTPLKGETEGAKAHGSAPASQSDLPPTLPRRKCPLCGEMKLLSEFKTRKRRGKLSAQPYCYPCQIEYHRSWRQTENGKQLLAAANRKTQERHPEHRRAREAARVAVVSGRLTKGPCEMASPQCKGGIEAHHDDYSKPLNVRWVCRRHHRILDRQALSTTSGDAQ